jgi:hypothetical protein
MSKRLEILESSLIKKESAFNAKLDDHFATVKAANGQPLNDKRNGHKTLEKWEKQNNALRNRLEGIEKTKQAIEREKDKIADVESFDVPAPIQRLIDDGVLNQWRKFPNRFFVAGVEKARIVFEDGKLFCSYARQIPNKDQYAIFRDVYNNLKKEIG